MESSLCTIQKKERINFLTEQYVFQSCLLTAQDNSKIKFDILKLSSISPLIRSILTSFSVPVSLLGTVDIILPDVSVVKIRAWQKSQVSGHNSSHPTLAEANQGESR